jgi:hypothetical protein
MVIESIAEKNLSFWTVERLPGDQRRPVRRNSRG